MEEEEIRPDNGVLNAADMVWAKPGPAPENGKKTVKVTDYVKAGDIILVELKGEDGNEYALKQIPEANGGLIAMDPHTGRILALVGGYSFSQSQFNRASQAFRQPGSAFKPFVYAAALDNGFTPSSQVLDAPFVIERQDIDCEENDRGVLELRGANEDGQIDGGNATSDECERFYKPSNYAEGRFYGLSTLRLGLEKSRNAMTVRLANDIGMAPIMDYGTRFGVYDEVKPELAWALGAGETTLIKMATAYSMLVNGGKRIQPSILDRVQDGTGKTILIADDEACDVCQVDEWTGDPPPELPDEREDVIDPVTAYQVVYMLQGVVENGTGIIIKSLNRPLGGKTGTTNDYLDAWFMGFSPDLVAGIYVGYDTPKPLNNEAGGKAAAPIFKAFMKEALKNEPIVPFRIPEGVTLVPVNRNSGEPSYIGAPEFILEAFKPGNEPRLGDLSSTIRVGSGSDSFISRGYDDYDSLEDDYLEEDEPTNSGSNSDGNPVDTSAENTETPTPEPVSATPPQDEEDELEDGLY